MVAKNVLGAKAYYTLTWMDVVKKNCINNDHMCSFIIFIYIYLIISEVSNIFPGLYSVFVLFQMGPDCIFDFGNIWSKKKTIYVYCEWTSVEYHLVKERGNPGIPLS